jgi:hypothetical protein
MAILRNTTFTETGGFLSLPAGTTAQRPSLYTSATIVQLTTVGTSTWTVPAGVTSIEMLLVAGGGGGGYQVGGGGGGGGVVYRNAYPVTPGASISYTIGGGGTGASASVAATNGQDTTFGAGAEQVVAKGGGAGANHNTGTGGYDGVGQQGGSGGGGAGDSSSRSQRGGYPVDGQGYPGGRGRGGNHPGFSGDAWAGGGGGGAGGPGGDSNVNAQGGRGGAGIATNITWNGTGAQTLTNYGGGGGGCNSATGNPRAAGGIGGGGAGVGNSEDGVWKNGVANTGGGGGGVRDTSGNGGNGGSGIIIIRYFADRQPLVAGSVRLNTDIGRVEQFQSNGVWGQLSIPFLTRQIITTAYILGGYKDAAAWNNVNRTSVATDVTINLGDGALERSFNYQGGACSTNLAYVFGAGNGHAINSNYVIAFNMRTEQAYNPGSGMSRTMAGSRWTFGTMFKETYLAWSAGGGNAALEEYNMTTQTLIGTITSVRQSGNTWAMSHENFGFIYWANDQDRFDFATRTLQSAGIRGGGVSNHDQQKSIQSKYMWAWAGAQGDYAGGNTLRRTNMQTDTTMGTVSKPVGNSGEENLTIGQDWQYMLGMYNGAQNNVSWKWFYGTETGTQNSSTLEPKGKGGASSGVCSWRD